MDRRNRVNGNAAYLQATDFIQYLKREHGLPVRGAYLFGSHAKNRAHRWSDIDVCVISPTFRHRNPLSYLWQKRRWIDVEHGIAPVGYDPKEFESDSPSPLVFEIRKTGKKLPI